MSIRQASGGFGMYQQSTESSDGWADESDLLCEIKNSIDTELFELGDNLPAGFEDIRGRIYNQAGRIFGWLDENDDAHYFAIVSDE